MDALIDHIRARIAAGRPNDHPGEWLPVQPPVSAETVSAAEVQLGFRLPELLRRLYTEVGNGGFGPVFGLIPLSAESLGGSPPPEAEFDLVGGYVRLRRRYGDEWPAGLVPVFYCGCTVFEFVDCQHLAAVVLPFDEGTERPTELPALATRAPALASRLESWLTADPPAW